VAGKCRESEGPCPEAMAFLSNLPSFNKENFSTKHSVPKTQKTTIQSPAQYLPTHDTSPPPDQVISTERTNLLLRYLNNKQLSGRKEKRKNKSLDREVSSEERKSKRHKPKADGANPSKGKEPIRHEDEEDDYPFEFQEENEEEEREEEEDKEKKRKKSLAKMEVETTLVATPGKTKPTKSRKRKKTT